MAMPENSKAVRSWPGLAKNSQARSSTRDPADKASGRPGLGGVATGWVQGCGCGSSKGSRRVWMC